MRLILHTAAYWLMLTVREAIPRPQPLAGGEFSTIRLRLLSRSVSPPRSSVGSRTGAPVVSRHPDLPTFPAPSTSHAACGFPALRAPIRFAPRFM
jgi:hypothetical protein